MFLSDFLYMKKPNLEQPAVILAHPRLPEGQVIDWISAPLKLTRKQKRQLKKMGNPKIATLLFDQQNGIVALGTAAEMEAPSVEKTFNSAAEG